MARFRLIVALLAFTATAASAQVAQDDPGIHEYALAKPGTVRA